MKIILLPYFGGSSRSYDGVIDHLQGYECVPLSLANIGSSPYSVRRAMSDVAKRISGVIEDEFVLIGHSMGGKLALGIASENPVGLRGVVLIAPSPLSPEPLPESVRMAMLANHGTREAAIHTITGASYRELSPEVLEAAIEGNLQTDPTDWKNWLEIGHKEDLSELLEFIKCPVLIMTGEFDVNMNPEFLTREIGEKIPGTEVKVIAGAGHLLPQEAPEEVAKLIKDWLQHLD
jgi:pimeloyl-ACP methyl ester carboxylesterase